MSSPAAQIDAKESNTRKPRLATVWLGGCSGCHMSLLDVDEWILDMAQLVDVVYSPVIDIKEYPHDVDIALVEGAVANEDNLEMILKVRERTKLIVAFGDCAVTGNVTALRNPLGTAKVVLESCYLDHNDLHAQIPRTERILPVLVEQVRPLHEIVHVDRYIHGCPPNARQIRAAIEDLLGVTGAGVTDSAVKFG